MNEHVPGLMEEPSTFDRPIVERVIARPFRDAAFARAVKSAYADTCAITGLKIINGGGRSEVQAAHIRPVVSQGPDSVRNGRSEEHTSELQSLMRISYAVFCLKKKNTTPHTRTITNNTQ